MTTLLNRMESCCHFYHQAACSCSKLFCVPFGSCPRARKWMSVEREGWSGAEDPSDLSKQHASQDTVEWPADLPSGELAALQCVLQPACPGHKSAGALREPGILVLRLEGPLFYANAGAPEAPEDLVLCCHCLARWKTSNLHVFGNGLIHAAVPY